ncbi:hypothetical protein HEP84_55435 [Streptomyces sp. RLB1-33]|nr:hypothetical protein [Streptomyces sp. RLB1-33]
MAGLGKPAPRQAEVDHGARADRLTTDEREELAVGLLARRPSTGTSATTRSW